MIKLGEVALYVRSMGKMLRVTAIAETVDEANTLCARSDNAVVACLPADRLILLADMHDRGIAVPRDVPVCSNCGQFIHSGDCLNECRKRGFTQ